MDVGKDNAIHCGKDGGEDSGDAQMNEVRVFGVKFTLFFSNETLPNNFICYMFLGLITHIK